MRVLIPLSCALVLAACASRPSPVKPGEGRTYVTPGGVEVFHRNRCGFFAHEIGYKGVITIYNLAIRADGRLRDQPTFTLGEARKSSWLAEAQISRNTKDAVYALGRFTNVATDACWHGQHSRGEDRKVAWQLQDEATSALVDWGLRMETAESADDLHAMTVKANVEAEALGQRRWNLVQPYCFRGLPASERCPDPEAG